MRIDVNDEEVLVVALDRLIDGIAQQAWRVSIPRSQGRGPT